MYKQRVKIFFAWYLYLAAIIGGLAWVFYFSWNAYHAPEPKPIGQDYLYEQQQLLQRQIDSLKLEKLND